MTALRSHKLPCGCDPALTLPIGERAMVRGPNHDVVACVGCGRVDLVEAVVDEPRPHDVRLLGYRSVGLTEPELMWIGRFPRRLSDRAWLGHEVRVVDPAALDRLAEGSPEGPLLMGLLAAGVPSDPAPDGLSAVVAGFRDVCDLIREVPTASLAQWVGWAAGHPGQRLALDYLAHIQGVVPLLVERAGELGAHGERVIGQLGADDPAALAWYEGRLDLAAAGSVDGLREQVETLAWLAHALKAPASVGPKLAGLADRLDPAVDHYAIKRLRDQAGRL